MKKYRLIIPILIVLFMSISACEEYLDVAPELDVTEEDVFGEYRSFQGFVDRIYGDMTDFTKNDQRSSWTWADEAIQTRPWITDARMDRGDYPSLLNCNFCPFNDNNTGDISNNGYWDSSWKGIRKANLGLARLNVLTNATDEERRLLKGQLYFFRAFYHLELMMHWGGLPYVDTYLTPDDDLRIPRLTYLETAEKVNTDLDSAIALLPVNWDDTSVGSQLAQGSAPGASPNTGLVNKGAAMGVKAQNLMFAASPLMNGASTGVYEYDTEYASRAAEAAWEVIKLADQGVYQLEPWTTYGEMFLKDDGTIPSRKEVIWTHPVIHSPNRFNGNGVYQINALGGGGTVSTPTANYVDLFEADNGYPIDHPNANHNPNDPWVNRDPRFSVNIRVDGEEQTVTSSGNAANHHIAQLYVGGRHRNTNNGSITGFIVKKFVGIRQNQFDGFYNNYYIECPRLRLSEMYLIYAEMVNEAFSDPNASVTGAALTGVQAVNIVRSRAGQVDLPAEFTADKLGFRERVRNERAVELAFEHKRWYDIRRWYVAHLTEYKEEYRLDFDENYTFFEKVLVQERVFDLKHYWLPFPNEQVTLYNEFYQNPGW